jgi:putative type II/III system pilus formation protein
LTNPAEPSGMRQLAFALALAVAPAAALAATLDVPLDQSAFVTLAAPAHNVIIGNPAIADVSVADQRHIIITGKGAGITNLVITDARGHAIFDRQIVVGAGSGNRVALINGSQIISYTCAPVCEQVGGAAGAQPAAAPAPAGGAIEAPRGSIAASPNTP